MEALRIIIEEHESLAAILHAIRFMLKEIGAGRLAPDVELLKAMVHYLDAYPEKRHHPKEDDFLFARLKVRTTEGAEALARLEQQHAGAAQRIRLLQDAVDAFAQDRSQWQKLSDAFDSYAEFYRNHMLLEEQEILPLTRKHLTPEDWATVDAAFNAERDPMAIGGTAEPAGEDFTVLFSRLVAAAPPPLGLGAGPYRP